VGRIIQMDGMTQSSTVGSSFFQFWQDRGQFVTKHAN